MRLLGRAHGTGLYALARAEDDRAVQPSREAKSISVEDTYDTDHVDKRLLEALLDRQAAKVTERLRKARLSGRTVSIKVRLHDFSTLSRSATLPEPSDDGRADRPRRAAAARRAGHLRRRTPARGGRLRRSPTGSRRTSSPTRTTSSSPCPTRTTAAAGRRPPQRRRGWAPGMDVVHAEHGRGWVWGSGRGVVTVRFETAETGPGRVLSLAADDPDARRRSDHPKRDLVAGTQLGARRQVLGHAPRRRPGSRPSSGGR